MARSIPLTELQTNLASLLVSAVDALNKARANCESADVIQACEAHVRNVESLIAKWSKSTGSSPGKQ